MFDPEALVARWRGGAGEAELLVQPAGKPSPIPAAHGMGGGCLLAPPLQ
jgi:hypothetical protein